VFSCDDASDLIKKNLNLHNNDDSISIEDWELFLTLRFRDSQEETDRKLEQLHKENKLLKISEDYFYNFKFEEFQYGKNANAKISTKFYQDKLYYLRLDIEFGDADTWTYSNLEKLYDSKYLKLGFDKEEDYFSHLQMKKQEIDYLNGGLKINISHTYLGINHSVHITYTDRAITNRIIEEERKREKENIEGLNDDI
tara:strand:+ start:88 stop:678 length:591 start_codon:yes stop_codon:yes gene_type:complete